MTKQWVTHSLWFYATPFYYISVNHLFNVPDFGSNDQGIRASSYNKSVSMMIMRFLETSKLKMDDENTKCLRGSWSDSVREFALVVRSMSCNRSLAACDVG